MNMLRNKLSVNRGSHCHGTSAGVDILFFNYNGFCNTAHVDFKCVTTLPTVKPINYFKLYVF